jgi:hypothetical protein
MRLRYYHGYHRSYVLHLQGELDGDGVRAGTEQWQFR